MKILVPFKRVPAPETRIRLLPDGSGIETDGVTFVINPFDEIALEEALRIRERDGVEEIVAVTIGAEECAEQVRTALGMGADRAIHVMSVKSGCPREWVMGEPESGHSALDSAAVSRLLEAVARRERPDLVLMGKQAIDDDANQAGQMLAARLGWPQASFVSRVEFVREGAWAECTRETDAGLETVRIRLPAVLTTDLRLNEPRYVSLPGIMRARSKPVETLTPADLGIALRTMSRVHALEPPPFRPPGRRVASVEELVQCLHEEARVL